MKLFDKTTVPLLTKALDAYALRQRVIASNISNINTPQYKGQSVSFEQELSRAMEGSTLPGSQTNEKHFTVGTPSAHNLVPVIQETNLGGDSADALASGVNNVDVDFEMAELAKNQLRFKFASRLIGDAFRGIQKSIRGQS